MKKEVDNSISKFSHIHSITADFLAKKLQEKGLPEFVSSHGNILFQLSVQEKMKMGELAEKINRDKSTTTVLVRKLEKDGLIQIEADVLDKRNRYISLTEKGKEYNNLTRDLSKELQDTFYQGFSDKEKEQLYKFLTRIEKNFYIKKN